jgi:hypothetical protein
MKAVWTDYIRAVFEEYTQRPGIGSTSLDEIIPPDKTLDLYSFDSYLDQFLETYKLDFVHLLDKSDVAG